MIRYRAILVTLSAVVSVATSAFAQLPSPSRATSIGVFGRSNARPPDRSFVGLSGSVYGAYDSDIVAQLSNTVVSRQAQRSGPLYGGDVGLEFRRPGRVDFGASARTGISYVPDLPEPSATSYGVMSDITLPLTRNLGFQASGRFEYAPRYSLASRLFERVGDGLLPPLDDGLLGVEPLPLESFRQDAHVGLTQSVSERGSIGISYRYHGADFSGFERALDVHTADVSYRHRLGRDLSARVGYGFRQSTHRVAAGAETFDSSHVIAGVDYDRGITLNMTRRTYVTFGFGTGVTQRETVDSNAGSNSSRLFLTGHLGLLHEMGRTWSTEVTYSRELRFVDGFAEPLLTGNVIGRVGGLLSERLEFGAFTRFGQGTGASTQVSTFRNIQSTAQVRYGISGSTGIFAQVYHVVFDAPDRDFDLPFLPANSFSRVGVRLGVSLWAPLIN